jgi:HPt (histidine-containing phosphotransfer) domain-containing protein
MAQAAGKIIDRTSGAVATVIDRGHLASMTLGDRDLEREVLQLFDRQADLLLARMRSGAPQTVMALAHTLRGSASSIGVNKVASAAEAVEQAAGGAECVTAMQALARTIDEARAEIAVLLRD